MPRPHKQGLAFYRKDTGFYCNPDIISLLMDFGPRGVVIYEVLIDLIYANGYYLEFPLNKVAAMVQRIVGGRWIPSVDLVLQVSHYCADLGMFDKDLLSQSVLTSVKIQEDYSKSTVRNKVDKSKYWLLEEERGVGGSMPQKNVSATETPISVTKTPISVTEMKQDKIRKDKIRRYSANREKERMGNFDTEDFFHRAVEASYEKFKEKEKEKNEKTDVHSV